MIPKFNNIDIKKMHKIHLGLLNELKRICDKHNLRYYLSCGTCIGAIRHKGFIPWDYDIDVFMHIEDVHQLEQYANEFQEPFFFQSKITDPQFDGFIFRLCNSNTTYIMKDTINQDKNHGFWLDIYPLYFAPKNVLKLKRNIVLSWVEKLFLANRPPVNHGKGIQLIAKCLLAIIPLKIKKIVVNYIQNKLEKPYNTDKLLIYYGLDITFFSAILYKSQWFNIPSQLVFENNLYSGPTDCDAYLTKRYGNYMTLPPEGKRFEDFCDVVFIDLEHSYLSYKGKHYCKE